MDDPAIEVNSVFSETIPLKFREISYKENRTPKLGPCSVKANPVCCSLYPIHTEGIVLGMDAGEVLHWNLEYDRARTVVAMGHHKGAVTSLQSSFGKDTFGTDLVVSGASDGTAKIWKECSGTDVQHFLLLQSSRSWCNKPSNLLASLVLRACAG